MNFGFSYVGLIYVCLLFAPNLLWTKRKPEGYKQHVQRESRILLAFERAGEVLACCAVLLFSDFNLGQPWPWSLWLLASAVLMFLYEVWWVRYFRGPKTMADFYSSLGPVPVAGAALPVAAFFLLGIYGKNPVLIIAAIILGIGHIGIHLAHKKEVIV